MPHHQRRNQQVAAESPLRLITTKIRHCCLYRGNIHKSVRLDLAGRSFCFKYCNQMNECLNYEVLDAESHCPNIYIKYLYVVIPFLKEEICNLRNLYRRRRKNQLLLILYQVD